MKARCGFLLVLLAATPGCDREPPRKTVRLTVESGSSPSPAAAPAVLRVGVGSVLSPRSTLRHYRDLIENLGERLDVPTEMVLRPNYSEMNELLRQRYCMVGLLCDYAFVRAERDFGVEILAAPQVAGEATYRAYIIVGRDSPFRSLGDLAGKRFAYADPLCNAGWLYPIHRLRSLGDPARTFFIGDIFTYDYEESIRAVAEGLVDAAGVESPLYDSLTAQGNPTALRTRIVDRSLPFGTPPVVVHPDLDPKLRARVQEFFLALDRDERGRRLLEAIAVDRFVVPQKGPYTPVFAMAEALEQR